MSIVTKQESKGGSSFKSKPPQGGNLAGGLIRPRDGNPEVALVLSPVLSPKTPIRQAKTALVRSAELYLGLILDETTRISPRRNTSQKLMHPQRAVV